MLSEIFEETEVEVRIMKLRHVICESSFMVHADSSSRSEFFCEINIFPELCILRLAQGCTAREN